MLTSVEALFYGNVQAGDTLHSAEFLFIYCHTVKSGIGNFMAITIIVPTMKLNVVIKSCVTQKGI